MTILDFDESRLSQALQSLARTARPVFAAACATRLAPAFARFAALTQRRDAQLHASILSGLWRTLASNSKADIKASIQAAMTLVPEEDDGPWVQEREFAEDAAAALVYALQFFDRGEIEYSVLAARRAYEAVNTWTTITEDVRELTSHAPS